MNSINAAPLRILSWNVFQLPIPVNFTSQRQRLNALIEYLKQRDDDLILLQECFDKRGRQHLVNSLKNHFPYFSFNEIKTRYRHFMDSGLLTMSRRPLDGLQTITYSSAAHADQFAAKGALSAKLSFNEFNLHIINTHLQAWNTSRAKEARKRQLFELNSWIRSMRSSETIELLVGDLNMDFHFDKEIFDACRTLEMNISQLVGERQYSHQMKKWLDYVLVWAGNRSVKVNTEILDLPQTPDGKSVSDHHPLLTTVSFAAT